MTPAKRARPQIIDSAQMLGIAAYRRRRSLKLNQREVAVRANLERTTVSQLERGRGDAAHFRVVLLVVNALGMDIELRSRDWTPTGADPLDPATSVADIGLSPNVLACLQTVGIREVGQLGRADDLIQRPEFGSGTELYEVACALNRHGLSLPADRHGRVPGDREREMFRLRVVEGLTLNEVAERIGVKSERARQLLNSYFGLKGIPPAARERRRTATEKRRAEELAAARDVQTELIAGWRTGQRPQDLAGWFGVSVASVQEVISSAVTESDRRVRARVRANQRRKGGWRPR